MRNLIKETKMFRYSYAKISMPSFIFFVLILWACSNENNKQTELIETGETTQIKRTYYKDSRNIVSEVGLINDTVLNGFYRIYGPYRDILFDGEYTKGNEDGVFRWYYGYKNDYSIWHSKHYNFVEHEGVYRNGRKVGQWRYFYPNGFIKGMITYDSNSNEISNYHFDSNGTFLH
jgi:antitoxin component YwqK of YwqJK toxin-antitoxin module